MKAPAGFALILAACGPGAATAPPFESLALAADTLEAPWTNLPAAAAMGPGRWAVVAGDWDAAAIADFTGKSLTPLGGAKQQAFQHPSAVFTVGDTIYLADWGKRRTTVWTGDGRLIDSIPSPDALRGVAPRGRDGAGQLYFEVRPLPGRGGIGNRDSAAIVRAPRDMARFDTVARLAPVDVRVRTGQRDVLHGVSGSLPERRIGVIGANGSGKSSPLCIMAGQDRDFQGGA